MNGNLLLQFAKVSLSTSVLIGLLLLLTPLIRRRYPARWRYAAWLLIGIRLLVPATLSLPQAPIQIEVPQQAMAYVAPQPIAAQPEPAPAPLSADLEAEVLPNQPPAEQVASAAFQEPAPTPRMQPLQIVGAVWVAGIIAFLLFQLASYQVFLYKLRRGWSKPVPDAMAATLWELGREMGICRLPQPMVTDQTEAPVLIGLLRPRLLLPHEGYSPEEARFILHHELVHYQRRDLGYKLILMLASALHWYNPLVHLMVREAGKDIELSCDDAVIRGLDRDARARYGSTILTALPRKRRLEPMFSTHFSSTKRTIKSRLRNLFDLRAKHRGIAALCAVVIGAGFATGLVTVGAAASGGNEAVVSRDGLNATVNSIGAGEAVCVGSVRLEPGVVYSGSASAGSGDGLFVALHESPDIKKHAAPGVSWNSHFGSGDGKKISQLWFSSNKPVTRYVYVGSRKGSLSDVSITLKQEGSSTAPVDSTVTLPVSVPSLQAGEVVSLGQIEITGGQLVYNVTGIGANLIVSLSEHGDIQGLTENKTWKYYAQSGSGNGTVTMSCTASPGIYYVYVAGGGAVSDIKGTISFEGGIVSTSTTSPVGIRKPLTPLLVHASGGSWAGAGSIEGDTYQAQLNAEVRWIEDTYKEHGQPFVISETVAGSEVTDTAHLQALYGASETFRTMSRMKDGMFVVADDSSFSRFGLSLQSYQRTAVMVDHDNALTLNVRYSLEKGRMAVWLVDPDGNIVYQGPSVQSHSGSHAAPGRKGLWSVVTITDESVDGSVNGASTITLQSAGQATALARQTSYAQETHGFTVRRWGSFDLTAGQQLDIDLRWSSGDTKMVLYTPTVYTDEDFQGLFENAILPGSSNGPSNVNPSRFNLTKGSQFNFSISKEKIQWKGDITTTDTYHVYFIHFDGPTQVTGEISVLSGDYRNTVLQVGDSANTGSKSTAVDQAAYEVMQYSGSWVMVEHMLPYMTRDGIDSVVRLHNQKSPANAKDASQYYGLATPSRSEADDTAYTLMSLSGNWAYSSPLFPFMSNSGIDDTIRLYNQKTGQRVNASSYYN